MRTVSHTGDPVSDFRQIIHALNFPEHILAFTAVGAEGGAFDDFPSYLLLAGRAGAANNPTLSTDSDGILLGSLASGKNLLLKANSVAAGGVAGAGQIQCYDTLRLWPTDQTVSGSKNCILASNVYTMASGVANLSILQFNGEIKLTASPSFGTPPFLFRASHKVRGTTTAGLTVGNPVSFYAAPTIIADGINMIVGDAFAAYYDSPVFTVANAGTLDPTSGYTAFGSVISVGAGNTLDVRRGLRVLDGAGAGTIVTQVAVDVETLTKGTTANLSLRSAGAGVQLRHAGPVVCGANAAPTNASVGLEVQSTTLAFLLPRMTTGQRDTMTTVAVADGMMIYNTTLGSAQYRKAGAWVSF